MIFRFRPLMLGLCVLSAAWVAERRLSASDPFDYRAAGQNDTVQATAASSYTISTVAGSGMRLGPPGFRDDDGVPATRAVLYMPDGVALDPAGNLYVTDQSCRIRKIATGTGVITTIAGTGWRGYAGDGGPARSAVLGGPGGLATDAAGNIYFADGGNDRVRRIAAATGIITTVAGNGDPAHSGDGGPAVRAGIYVGGIALDQAGNLYVTNWNDRVRRVSAATGIITTIAGAGGIRNSGDGRPAILAQLDRPSSVALDSMGNIYVAASGEQRIRKIHAASGVITTIAGSSPLETGFHGLIRYVGGFGGDGGPATAALFNHPRNAAVDKAGNLYVSDAGNSRIRKIDALTGIVETIAGTGVSGFSGDNGPAAKAQISYPAGIAVDDMGRVFFADLYNHRIRVLTPTEKSAAPPRALAHFAAGDTWTTGIFVINAGIQPAKFSIKLYNDFGNPNPFPFGSSRTSKLAGTVAAQGSAYFEAGNPQTPLNAGWGLIDADLSIVVQALFRNKSSGDVYYESAAPSNTGSKGFVLPFDATTFPATGAPLYTGLAVANLDATPASITCTSRDFSGRVIPDAVTLPALRPRGHYSGYLFPGLAGKRGTIACVSNTNIAATAFRFNGANAFSSVPAVNPAATGESARPRALAHFAVGDTWTTGITVVNTGDQAASFSIEFFDDSGKPIALPFDSGTVDSLSGTAPGRTSASFEAANPQMPVTAGWARIKADPSVTVQASFRNKSAGDIYYEAAAPSTVGSREFIIPFDATTLTASGVPFRTGLAFANLEEEQAFITCTARDPVGGIIPDAVAVPVVSPLGRYSGHEFPALAGKRGTIVCVSNTNVAAAAFGFSGNNGFSSLPVIAK